MPMYDFRCNQCGKQFSLLFKSFSEYEQATQFPCTACQSLDTVRRIGRVAVAKGEDAAMDRLTDKAFAAGVDENDPRSIGQFMRSMSNEIGEDLGSEFNEVVDRLEKGEAPDSIEQSMPTLLNPSDSSD